MSEPSEAAKLIADRIGWRILRPARWDEQALKDVTGWLDEALNVARRAALLEAAERYKDEDESWHVAAELRRMAEADK